MSSFSNRYPYTDFHELNLDWFLQEFNKLLEEWANLAESNEAFKQDMIERFGTLSDTVQEFTTFVTNYFDNLDVQEEINHKLDVMAADGTLDALLLPYFNEYKGQINQIVNTQNSRISVLEGRMDTFASLPDGSTAGDAELEDIRIGADGHVYASAGNAVRGQVEDLNDKIDDIDDILIDTKLYIPQPSVTYIGNYTIGNTGKVTAHANYNAYIVTIGKIEEVNLDHCEIYGYFNTLPAVNVDAMDNDRHWGAENIDITVPSGCLYILAIVTVASGYTVHAKNADYSNTITDDIEKLNDDFDFIVDENGGYNILTGVKTTGHWRTYTDEDRENSSWNYFTYTGDFEGKTFDITTKAGSNARCANFYNSDDELIGTSPAQATVETRTERLTAPEGTVKIIVNTNDTSIDPVVKELFDVIDANLIYYDNKSLPDIIDSLESQSGKLFGKTICCCGDSITYGTDMDPEGFTDETRATVYQSDANGDFALVTGNYRMTWNWHIADRNSMTLYNAGVGGSTMEGLIAHHGFSLENGRYTKLPDNIDYLLLWFGWNDAAYGTLGTINDDTNQSFYGGYNVVIPYLQNKYPYAKIALIVPFGSDDGHREAIRLLGNKWGLAVWDNYLGGTPLYYGKEDSVGVKASVVNANRLKFQANGAHPNHYGHKQLADMIEEFLKGI